MILIHWLRYLGLVVYNFNWDTTKMCTISFLFFSLVSVIRSGMVSVRPCSKAEKTDYSARLSSFRFWFEIVICAIVSYMFITPITERKKCQPGWPIFFTLDINWNLCLKSICFPVIVFYSFHVNNLFPVIYIKATNEKWNTASLLSLSFLQFIYVFSQLYFFSMQGLLFSSRTRS